MKILAASHVVPISAPPIENGAVAMNGPAIVAVGTAADLSSAYPQEEIEDMGQAAILPGFVNCHAHLEVTAMRGALDSVEHDFSAWLLKLTAIRQGYSEDDIRLSALAGAAEAASAGVTCIGDIGRFGAAGLEALRTAGLRGTLYQETEFYVDDRSAETDVKGLIDKYETLERECTELVRVGISPHSPYTVGRRQLELLGDFCMANNVPMTIHAAESADEQELLMAGTGFFPGIYRKFGVTWQSPFCSSVEYLDRLGVLAARPLLAHCVNVSDQDLQLIAGSGSTVAHCPTSNAKFGHGWAPFEKMLTAGIKAGLGSDSVASNNTCDLLSEARLAALAARNRRETERMITAQEVLEAATLGGARAMGLDHLTGSLEAGKQADIAVVSLARLAQAPVTDVLAALVFSSGAADVVRTIVAGRDVYSDGKVHALDEDELKIRLQSLAV